MSNSTTQTPAVGDPVFFEGLPSKITRLNVELNKVEFVSDLTVTVPRNEPDGSTSLETKPRFRTVANLSDLLWSSRYNVWYLWGRLLCKSRGSLGEEQRRVVAFLRDRKLLASRPTRDRGSYPTAGEQLGLYYCLFSKPGINWRQEVQNVERREGLSSEAAAACAEFDSDMECKFGFAEFGDGDPAATRRN